MREREGIPGHSTPALFNFSIYVIRAPLFLLLFFHRAFYNFKDEGRRKGGLLWEAKIILRRETDTERTRRGGDERGEKRRDQSNNDDDFKVNDLE